LDDIQFQELVKGVDYLSRWDMAHTLPGMIDNKGMKEVGEACPKITITSEAMLDHMEGDFAEKGLKGPRSGLINFVIKGQDASVVEERYNKSIKKQEGLGRIEDTKAP
jgi:hypothetical protein